MKIEEVTIGDIRLILLEGRIDSNTSAEAETIIMSVIESGVHKLVVDFGQLDYISSAGLRVFLLAAKLLKKTNGRIALSSMKPHIREVFDMSGFSALFTILPNKEDAVSSMQ
ncbi:MAG: STAS domain-containing protein [Ignavibacteria bacterium]|nr:STAS domain-containing protein [Ignavibacteria bacterium]